MPEDELDKEYYGIEEEKEKQKNFIQMIVNYLKEQKQTAKPKLEGTV